MVKQFIRVSLPAFWLTPAPQTLTKLMKVPISILGRLTIRIAIYLDDMLLLRKIIDEVLMVKDTVIFLLEHLGLKKSGKIRFNTNTEDPIFRSILVDLIRMALSLCTPEKLEKIHQLYWEIYNAPKLSIRNCEIYRPIIISSTGSLPSPICRKGKIQALHKNCLYQKIIELDWKCKQELLW